LKVEFKFIQSANIFLNKQGFAKLGDMNVSKVSKKGLCETQTGTPYYASP
jgi:serine/threonine protein kinase